MGQGRSSPALCFLLSPPWEDRKVGMAFGEPLKSADWPRKQK